MDIIDGINYYSNTDYNAGCYQPKEIYIHDFNMDNLPICAKYHILQEFINMNWKQLNEYALKFTWIRKETIQNANIFYKDHLIYLENNSIINIFKY